MGKVDIWKNIGYNCNYSDVIIPAMQVFKTPE